MRSFPFIIQNCFRFRIKNLIQWKIRPQCKGLSASNTGAAWQGNAPAKDFTSLKTETPSIKGSKILSLLQYGLCLLVRSFNMPSVSCFALMCSPPCPGVCPPCPLCPALLHYLVLQYVLPVLQLGRSEPGRPSSVSTRGQSCAPSDPRTLCRASSRLSFEPPCRVHSV